MSHVMFHISHVKCHTKNIQQCCTVIYSVYFLVYTALHFHIVPHRKFDRIGGTSSANLPNFKYVAPREICTERNCFDCPIEK